MENITLEQATKLTSSIMELNLLQESRMEELRELQTKQMKELLVQSGLPPNSTRVFTKHVWEVSRALDEKDKEVRDLKLKKHPSLLQIEVNEVLRAKRQLEAQLELADTDPVKALQNVCDRAKKTLDSIPKY